MNSVLAESILSQAWFGLIGLMLILYVVTDGFDLGVGILSLLRARDEEAHRSVMIQSIGHVWDANETWLVALGGALFGAFPSAYAMLLSKLYAPIMLLIASLIMRGASIEFRHVAATRRLLWDRVFGFGSLLAAISQGVILGEVITGLQPGALDSCFVAVTVIGVVSGYALLGATWLVKKTEGSLQRAARQSSIVAVCTTVVSAIVLSIGTFTVSSIGRAHWTNPSVFALLVCCALIAAAAVCYIVYATCVGGESGPFHASVVLFVTSFLGLVVSLFPDFVPGKLSIAAAASNTSTLTFMLIGIGAVFPVMLAYNLFQYHCFKGKAVLAGH